MAILSSFRHAAPLKKKKVNFMFPWSIHIFPKLANTMYKVDHDYVVTGKQTEKHRIYRDNDLGFMRFLL